MNDVWTLRPFEPEDRAAIIALWQDCGLTTAWNDPNADIDLCLATKNSRLVVAQQADRPVGSVMVGTDGHRGWVYFLAVADDFRGKGLGRDLMATAEAWLKARKVPKVQLLVRQTNLDITNFYARNGYHRNSCWIMQKWLTERDSPPVPGNDDASLPVTITYLEMTERPYNSPRPLPRNMKAALLRALKPSPEFYRFLYRGVGEPWLWWERLILSDEALTAVIHDPLVEIYVLYVDGVPAGYGELDRRKRPDINLNLFGLMPEFVGLGLGAYFLTSIIDIAWSHEPKKLLVNTNTLDHPRALSIYQRCGFSPIGQEETVFIDPRRNGIIMA